MISQSSFGARVDNAKKILAHLSTFTGYTAPGEQSVAGFGAFLTTLEESNKDAAVKADAYATATGNRQQTFVKGDNSLKELAEQILSTLFSLESITPKQVQAVRTMVNKITGARPRKPKPPKPPKAESDPSQPPPAEIPKSISRREAGFGNKLKLFGDIVATVKNYGASYAPTNPRLAIPELETRLAELSQINNSVMLTFSTLRQKQTERGGQYAKLKDLVTRIKHNVRSQKGRKSVEYKLVRAIRLYN